ncbi:hypothetical protein [Litorimonas taeanensis]|nr:hypothetical protein [Litorimonas taeanensis]
MDNLGVPQSLQNKWRAEDQKTYLRHQDSSAAQRPQNNQPSNLVRLQGKKVDVWSLGESAANSALRSAQKMTKESFGSKSRQKQLEDSEDRNIEQTKNLARSGDGVPIDKNFNRRDDWGHRGAGKTAVGPFIAAVVTAVFIAVFFIMY